MISCLIVDDEPDAALLVENYVLNTPGLELIATCHKSSEALTMLKTHQVDLLLLDIKMPNMNGFELLQQLKQRPQVIVITAHIEYALFGYQFDLLDYLLKPASLEDFQQAVLKYNVGQSNHSENKTNDCFYIKDEYKWIKIRVNEILYIESFREYVHLHTIDSQKYVFRKSLREIEAKLKTHDFFRVHKSYIVALNTIDSIEGNRIYIQSHQIPIGKSYKEAFFNGLDLL